MVIVPLGYTVHEVYASGGNPYGTSYTSGTNLPGHLDEDTLKVARAQGARLARFAAVIAPALADGRLPPAGAQRN